MHFTYARIATVDTYVVFFSLVSWIYFLKYLKTRNSKSTNHCDLVLWAVSSGLAFSTKWYSLFGLLGQLIILLTSRSHLLPETRLSLAEKQWGSKLKVLVHFTIISGAVYLATYLPQALQGYTLQDVVADQFQMLSFHTSLNATHPFSSPWYSWPMIIKPLWIFVSNLSANAVSTIVAMGNPAIWWLGFAATFLCIYRFYQHRDMISLFIPAIYLSQWLPYALLSRPLFIYHYYINVPILCLAIAVLLSKAWERKRLRPFILAYLLVAAGLFIAFYPVISGNSASRDLVDSLRWFSSWVF
jgi:dolichyl-phosphate-mannose--protein O-mannosyl transferase